MLNETVSTAAMIAAWSADVYVKEPVKHADALLGPLAKCCVTLLCGPRGVGKSWLALALAHTAARGGTLANWRARKSSRVVYIDVAGSAAVLHERLIALGPDKPPPSLTIVSGDAQANGLPDLSLEIGRTALDQLITDADLVVIDGVSALVRKGRGVGERWAALERWLRSLRHRHMAVLLVDTKEPNALSDVADTMLKVNSPADGVQEGDLRLQAKLMSSRPDLKDTHRFELRLALRKNGAAWTYVHDLDHRAIMAYRLDRADYSSREIAKLLDVSPATAWRLVGRGEKLPAHIRDGVDLVVPQPPRPAPEQRDWFALLHKSGLIDARGNWRPVPPSGEPTTPLPNGEREGPAADRLREGEGENTADIAPLADTAPGALRAPPHLNPPPVGGRTSEGETAGQALEPQTTQPGEAVKQAEAPANLDDVATDELVAIYLARRRHWKDGIAPTPDRLAAFSYEMLMSAARARLSARVLNRRILEDGTVRCLRTGR